jgi:flavodoxin I
MKILVIYDSFYGNTEKIAMEIGKALGPGNNISVVRITKARQEALAGVNLLIVGSPTRAFKPTRAITSFLKKIPSGTLINVKAAAFDTRAVMEEVKSRLLRMLARRFGYAAKPIADKLVKKGAALVVKPEGFYVGGTEGPLKDGELKRAAAWAKPLAGK